MHTCQYSMPSYHRAVPSQRQPNLNNLAHRQTSLAISFSSLVNANQFDIEDQGGIRRNQTWETSVTVSLVAWDGQFASFADTQLRNGIVPSLDDLTDTNGTLERLTSVTGGVELLTRFQGSGVVDGDQVTGLWEGLTVAGGQDFDLGGSRSRHFYGVQKVSDRRTEGLKEMCGAEHRGAALGD